MINNKPKKTKRLLKALVFISTMVLLIMVMYFNNHRNESPLPDQALCSSCHAMNANAMTWEMTSHQEIGCSSCHQDVSVTNVFSKKLSGRYNSPIEKMEPIRDEKCLSCHDPSETSVEPASDIIISHQLHTEKQISCVKCHSNLVHGNIKEEVIIPLELEPKDITKEKAEELISSSGSVLKDNCMSCHNGYKATSNCAACHSGY